MRLLEDFLPTDLHTGSLDGPKWADSSSKSNYRHHLCGKGRGRMIFCTLTGMAEMGLALGVSHRSRSSSSHSQHSQARGVEEEEEHFQSGRRR